MEFFGGILKDQHSAFIYSDDPEDNMWLKDLFYWHKERSKNH